MKMMSAVVPRAGSVGSKPETSSVSQGAEATNGKEAEREAILQGLLGAVKACQARFGARRELATESEPCVANLCLALEAVLSHGLRKAPERSAAEGLWHVTEIVSSSLNLVRGSSESPPAFWPYVREQLTNHEKERFALCLRRVTTDVGRGRAWLRSSLNERSLERISHSLIWPAPASLSDAFYHSWAFIRDEERAGVLPTAAAGLASIVFAIGIDNEAMDRPSWNESGPLSPLSSSSPLSSEPIIAAPSAAVEKKKDGIPGKRLREKRRRKPPLHVISFEDDSPPATEGSGSSGAGTAAGISSSSPSSSSSSGGAGHALPEEWSLGAGSSGSVHRVPRLSVHSDDLSSTPFPVGSPSDRDAPILSSHSEDMEVATAALLATLHLTQSGVEASEEPPPDATGVEQEVKEEVVEAQEMTEEAEVVLEEKPQEQIVQGCSYAALVRENELLKQQLRKYVSAVQMLRREGRGSESEAQRPDSEAFREAREYEQKLVQVAEMHGELMEFNDRLQRTLRMRESQLARLLTIRHLHGDSDGDESVLEGELLSTGVWVPSAFLTGGGTDLHHVYQVYVRVGSDEWNIYRRYSQFHALNRALRRQLRERGNASHGNDRGGSGEDAESSWPRFPPKRIVGNRDASFVEERRRALQAFLQHLMVHIMHHERALRAPSGTLPTKEDLVKAVPFFGENFEQAGSSHNSGQISTTETSCPRYTGL
ncbi:sorting nexin-29 isoform X2 [Ischnura elegans]|nr:sorting nexin-29 isoform X2 [Ischnura elegans]XP_046398373.1 sorting nexin-29 isoform X2 [Ischnura elegans]